MKHDTTMNNKRHNPRRTRVLRCPPAWLAGLVLLLTPGVGWAQSLTLANPHWNITLSDYGYSDFLLDNTPGFEGREYLSGEWGAAVGYRLPNGSVVAPRFLDPLFLFPDWPTLSTFTVVTPIAQTGLNADNLPVAQSVIANADLQITLRHEMLDTIVGTPMGIAPASSPGASNAIASSRYVLKQTCTIKNISGAAIADLQLFQFLHGLHSQRGVYDDRAYPGALGEFHHDVTLAGVDPYSVGTNSSSLGLEDFLGFHASVAPSAYEIGRYGIEGNGLDDHSLGKPSDGVHLSIEDNWQNPPYSARLGTDNFAPAERWVSGAERWNLGTLAAGQSVGLEVILSLRTGTQVVPGTNSTGGCNGGSSVPGGEDYRFDDVTGAGSCFGEYSQADANEISVRIARGEFDTLTFLQPGGPQQIWKLQFSGSYAGTVGLTFGYDATSLPVGLDQSGLAIYQFDGAAWQKLATTVDTVGHTLRVTATYLSTFALGVDNGVSYRVLASESPAGAGTVTGGGTFAEGASATLVAAANTGYVFSNWTEGATVLGYSPGFSFAAHADRTLVANFVSVGANKAITTSALPSEGGTTSGDGAYAPGASVTVIAQANPGFKFSKWLTNGVPMSTARTNTFTVTGDRSLVAKFTPVYSVSVSADPSSAGSAEADSSSYEPGDVARLKAKPNSAYCFVNWTQNGAQVSTDPKYTFTVTGNRTLVGHFAYGRMIDASGYPGLGGIVTGGGIYQSGNTVTLVAAAKPGYAFQDWTENGNTVSLSETYSFTCTASRTLVANFIAGNPGLTVALSASPAVGGTVSGGGTFTNGAWVDLSAAAEPGYAFVNWTDHGTPVSSWSYYSFLAESNRVLVANFAAALTLATGVSDTNAGAAGGDGLFPLGAVVGVSATPRTGFAFTHWTENGTPVSSNANYTFTLAADRMPIANFTPDATSVTFDFDTATPSLTNSQPTPLTQSVGGVTANFDAATDPGFQVQSDTNLFWTLSKLSGKFLYPSLSGSDLFIRLSQPVTSLTLSFATFDWQDLITPTPIKLEAFVDSTNAPAGSATATGTINPADTVPVSGRMSLKSATPFNLVRVTLPAGGAQAATDFLVDNLTVTTIPALKMQLTAGGAVISWPVTGDYALQTNPTLGPGGWLEVSTGIVVVGAMQQFTVNSPAGTVFFRLVHR